ncbi:MAG: flagellar biosynthesis protein FliQ [Candidatus Lindowbacteria bacterium]|nr:flagellar biosynthesis protein FliQ [Candidatus Lindowbacteria bacterium]
MNQTLAVDLTRDALMMTIIISSPMLMIGMIVGLSISVLQTATSIQEQSLTFVPKLFAILLATALFGPWMIQRMVEYVITLITTMPTMAPSIGG